MRCLALTKNLNRCSRQATRWGFCQEHKKQPLVWLTFAVFTVLSGIASIHPYLSDTIDTQDEKVQRHLDLNIPFDTGWIFVGYYHEEKRVFTKGPFAVSAFSPTESASVAETVKGDVLRVTRPRNIIIARFKHDGLKHRFTPPGLVSGTLTDADYTGVKIPVSKLVQVEDCTSTSYTGPTMLPALWCRVSACTLDIPQCFSAFKQL
jgi:hypothetical protein